MNTQKQFDEPAVVARLQGVGVEYVVVASADYRFSLYAMSGPATSFVDTFDYFTAAVMHACQSVEAQLVDEGANESRPIPANVERCAVPGCDNERVSVTTGDPLDVTCRTHSIDPSAVDDGGPNHSRF